MGTEVFENVTFHVVRVSRKLVDYNIFGGRLLVPATDEFTTVKGDLSVEER